MLFSGNIVHTTDFEIPVVATICQPLSSVFLLIKLSISSSLGTTQMNLERLKFKISGCKLLKIKVNVWNLYV